LRWKTCGGFIELVVSWYWRCPQPSDIRCRR
jgi:hypothetical protein